MLSPARHEAPAHEPQQVDETSAPALSSIALCVGLDLGASRTKVAGVDADGRSRGHAVHKSGIDFTATPKARLAQALEMAAATDDDIAGAVSTGYGRGNVGFITEQTKTEIGCHARGGFHVFGEAITVVDIGGQDNKIIKIGPDGIRTRGPARSTAGSGSVRRIEHRISSQLVANEREHSNFLPVKEFP